MRIVRVGDIAEQVRGVTFARADAVDSPSDGYLPVLTAGNIQGGELVTTALTYIPSSIIRDRQRLRLNDVVVCTSSGSLSVVGKAARCRGGFVGGFGAFLKVLRPGPEVDPGYFAHFFQTPDYRRRVSVLAAGANINNLKNEHLDDLTLPLPALTEQRRIAAVLDQAAAIHSMRRRAADHLDGLVASVFESFFGHDPGDEADLVHACLKITDGTHHSPKTLDAGIPSVTAKHLTPRGLEFHANPWFVSPEDHAAIYARCDPQAGDVLYIKDGATTGRAAVNRYDFPFSMLSSLALLRPDPELILPEYLETWLNLPRTKLRMIGAMSGAAITRLTLTKIKAVKIPIPPLGAQKSFQELHRAVAVQASRIERALAADSNLLAGLQKRAFAGNL